MGVFIQLALFPGCEEDDARAAVEAAAHSAEFDVNLAACRYAHSHEGTQALIAGGEPGFAPLAKALSAAAQNPVMLLCIYDGGFWGYDFYGGRDEDHFSTMPEYFGPVSEEEKPAERQSLRARRLVPDTRRTRDSALPCRLGRMPAGRA